MRPNACDNVEPQLWRYIDRELSATALGTVTRHLRSCERCRRLYEERAKEAKLWRLAFLEAPFGESFVARFRGRFLAEELDALGFQPPQKRGFFSQRIISVAALLVLVPAVFFIGVHILRRESPGLGFCSVQGEMVVDGTVVTPGEARPIVPGAKCVVSQGSSVEFTVSSDVSSSAPTRAGDDGVEASIRIVGPARFRVDETATARNFGGFLEKGRLTAEVATRAWGESFAVKTPHVTVRVVGTRFTLNVGAEETELEVEKGSVQTRQVNSPTTEKCGPGDGCWLFRANRDPVAKRVSPAPLKGASGSPGASSPAAPPPSPTAPAPAPGASEPDPPPPDLDSPVNPLRPESSDRQRRPEDGGL